MTKNIRVSLFILRLAMGWAFFYAGITKILDPSWTAAGYLQGATTFPGFFQWLASPQNIIWVNFLNEWGLTLLGVALIIGIATRFSTTMGIVLMLLYYFPVLNFPLVGTHSYIIDDHIIYALVLVVLNVTRAGKYWGFDRVR